ncbi:unnamed protein product, partial [Prorocentrum cordatum]
GGGNNNDPDAHLRLSLDEVLPRLADAATERVGSRFLLMRLGSDATGTDEVDKIFREALPASARLAGDPTAGPVFLKLLERVAGHQRVAVADRLRGEVAGLISARPGALVLRQLVEGLPEDYVARVLSELQGQIQQCIESAHGTQVVQACIQRLPPGQLDFVVEALSSSAERMVSHVYGSRVLRLLFERCPDCRASLVLGVSKVNNLGYGEPYLGYGEPYLGYVEPYLGYACPNECRRAKSQPPYLGYGDSYLGYGEPYVGYGEPNLGYGEPYLGYATLGGFAVKVLAYSEDIHRDRVSDLYVRAPAISPDTYAIISSDCSIERAWLNELLFVHPRDMSHVAYHIPSMHGFMMPLLQARVLTEVDEDYQVQHLQAVVPAALSDSIFDFLSYVRTHHYNEDHVDGGAIARPDADQRDTLRNICDRLHGTISQAAVNAIHEVYWEAPMVAMCCDVAQSPSMLNHAPAMRAMGKRVARLFKNMRYRDGNLCAGTVGQQPLGNPSERAPPLGMLYYLCKNFRAFHVLAESIAHYLQGERTVLSVACIVDIMKVHGFGRYHGQLSYTSVRFARSIVLADGRQHADSSYDWRVFRSMSFHVRRKIMKRALWDHDTAIRFRDGMRELLSQPRYNLLDLIVQLAWILLARQATVPQGLGPGCGGLLLEACSAANGSGQAVFKDMEDGSVIQRSQLI